MDLMNMRSFTKLKIRRSLQNTRFTHWLPLYFGENEIFTVEKKNYDHESGEMVSKTKTVNTKERFEKHINQTMSFLCTGSTRKPYTGEQAMLVMLKLIGTHIVELMNGEKHISILAIRRLFNFLRLFIYFMKKDASIEKAIEEKLKAFISDPKARHKDNCKNMLDYQIMNSICSTIDKEAFKKCYVEEQLDR